MKTIVITGPSGSGKSFLTNKLLQLFDDSIVLKTDSYYRDNILIRFLSLFNFDIYDRPLSIKINEINKTLSYIYNKERLISFYHYDFNKKKSSQTRARIDYSSEKQFLILEGIFSHRLDLDYQKTVNIMCEDEKEICFKRRLKRDQLERGRNSNEVKNRFSKSWCLFYQNIQRYQNLNNIMVLNPLDKISYNTLVNNLLKLKNN